MNGHVILLGLLFISLATGAQGICGEPRLPRCRDFDNEHYCPENFEKVCGTDDVTYDSECALCAKNHKDNSNIQIKYVGTCEVAKPEV